MKKKSIIRELLKFPASDWKSCELDVPQRKYRFPKILDQSIHIKGCGKELRQIAVTNLGRELPTLLITNNFDEKPAHLLTRYAQRAMIENAIADGIHFFNLDALCSGVQIEVVGRPNVEIHLKMTQNTSSLGQARKPRLVRKNIEQKLSTEEAGKGKGKKG